MSQPADRNLLVGILALQLEFINRDQLIAAMQHWVANKSQTLEKILLDQSALQPDTHDLLLALVQKHMEMHGGDPEASLTKLSTIGTARDAIERLNDQELNKSLCRVSVSYDPYPTVPPSDDSQSKARFKILRPHAEGGLGQVFVAHDDELNREIALKEIRQKYATDQEARSRFLVEGEITGGLEHPGIVPVYGLGQYVDGRPFYAMRFIRGDSLKEAIERFHKGEKTNRDPGKRAVELRELLARFIDVCNALEYAHSRGVLHRDLKPANIMLGKYGETLVVDWGLAKVLSEAEHASEHPPLQPISALDSQQTELGSAIGTPAFMSPEQAEGRIDLLGVATDVYGLGATLYSLLTGRPPVEGKTTADVLRSVRNGEIENPRRMDPSVPKPLAAICLRALAKDPDARYASPRHLASDIEQWLADEPVAAYAESWYQRLSRWIRKNRTKAAAAFLVLATLAVSGAVIAWQQQQNRITLAELKISRAETKAEQIRTDMAKVETEKAELKTQKARVEAQNASLEANFANYLASRAKVDRLLDEQTEGWLAQSKAELDKLAISNVSAAGDSDWLANAHLRLRLGKELVRVGSPLNLNLRLGHLRFSETGRLAVLSQYRGGAATTTMSIMLLEADSMEEISRLQLDISKTVMNDGLAAMLRGERPKSEGLNDIVISEKLGLVAAITRKGTLAVWDLKNPDRPPKTLTGEPEPNPSRLLLDEDGRRFYVIRRDLIQEIEVAATEYKTRREWKGSFPARYAVWDPVRKRIVIGTGFSLLAFETTADTDEPQTVEVGSEQIAILPEKRLLFAAARKSCSILDADTLQQKSQLRFRDPELGDVVVRQMSVSTDGAYLALSLRDGDRNWSELWNLATSTRLKQIPGNSYSEPGIEFRPNSFRLGRIESRGISWWQIQNASSDEFVGVHARPARSASWNRDGSAVLIARDNSVDAWERDGTTIRLTSKLEFERTPDVFVAPAGKRGLAYYALTKTEGVARPWRGDGDQSSFAPPEKRVFRTFSFDPGSDARCFLIAPQDNNQGVFTADALQAYQLPDWQRLGSWDDSGAANAISGRGEIRTLHVDSQFVYAGLMDGTVRKHAKDPAVPLVSASVFKDRAIVRAIATSRVGDNDGEPQSGAEKSSIRIAVGSGSGEVVILDDDSLDKTHQLPPHFGSCMSVFWLSKSIVATAGSDGVVKCSRLKSDSSEVELLWRLRFPAGIAKAGVAGDRINILVEGERAVRSYPKSWFEPAAPLADRPMRTEP